MKESYSLDTISNEDLSLLEETPHKERYLRQAPHIDQMIQAIFQQGTHSIANAIEWTVICAPHIMIPEQYIDRYLQSPQLSQKNIILCYLQKHKNHPYYSKVEKDFSEMLCTLSQKKELSIPETSYISLCLLILEQKGEALLSKYPTLQHIISHNEYFQTIHQPQQEEIVKKTYSIRMYIQDFRRVISDILQDIRNLIQLL